MFTLEASLGWGRGLLVISILLFSLFISPDMTQSFNFVIFSEHTTTLSKTYGDNLNKLQDQFRKDSLRCK